MLILKSDTDFTDLRHLLQQNRDFCKGQKNDQGVLSEEGFYLRRPRLQCSLKNGCSHQHANSKFCGSLRQNNTASHLIALKIRIM